MQLGGIQINDTIARPSSRCLIAYTLRMALVTTLLQITERLCFWLRRPTTNIHMQIPGVKNIRYRRTTILYYLLIIPGEPGPTAYTLLYGNLASARHTGENPTYAVRHCCGLCDYTESWFVVLLDL